MVLLILVNQKMFTNPQDSWYEAILEGFPCYSLPFARNPSCKVAMIHPNMAPASSTSSW